MTNMELEIWELQEKFLERSKKVQIQKRKASGKQYNSPKIVLNSKYKDYIGKQFKVLTGKGELNNPSTDFKQNGEFLLIFFPQDWNKEK